MGYHKKGVEGHRSTSIGNAVQRDSTFTIGDGPAHGSHLTYGSAISAASEKFDAVTDAIEVRPKPWRLPVRGTFTDVLLPWTLHPQRCYLPAQHPDSTCPSTATATSASPCYFCQTRAHPTDGCNRPCPHCPKLRVHRATACHNRNSTLP
uniref:Uncharacterized protein n=1 Tax=Romanomermis culicivorax TaxID=13658 RepID=A0A915J2R0_ROMCU